MMTDNERISARQTRWILCLDMMAVGLFGVGDRLSGMNQSNMLCACLLALLIVNGIYFILFRVTYPRLCRVLHQRMSNVSQMFWDILFIIYYIGAIIVCVRYFLNIMDILIPTHYAYPLVFLVVALAYGASKGIEVRGRMAELTGWLVLIPFIWLFFSGFWQYVSQRTLDEIFEAFNFEMQFSEVMRGVVRVLPIFLVIDQPILLRQHQSGPSKHCGWWGGMLGGSAIIFLGLLLTTLYMTPQGMASEVHPFGIFLQMIRLPGNFISRYDIFFIMLWAMSFYMLLLSLSGNLIETVRRLLRR